MVIKAKYDGVTLTGDCHNGDFTRGEVRCPNCNTPLEQQVSEFGSAYLICPAKSRDCPNPVKSFAEAREMLEWLERAWESITEICGREGPR
jgi:hypothetical protein